MRVNVAYADKLGSVWRDPYRDCQGVRRARPSSYAASPVMSTPFTCPVQGGPGEQREQGVP